MEELESLKGAESDQKQDELSNKVEKLASMLHDEWREPRRIEGTNRKVNIDDTDYEDLSSDRREGNKKSEKARGKLIYGDDGSVMVMIERAPEPENELFEKISAKDHENWAKEDKERVPKEQKKLYPEEQKKPYEELPEEEKEKDRAIVRKGIEVYTEKE